MCSPRASISESTQPTLPSPPHTRMRKVENFWKRRSLRGAEGRRRALGGVPPGSLRCHPRAGAHPRCGPPFMRSKTWAGLRNCLNLRRNLTPWLSPLLELTKARRGLEQVEGQVAFQKPAGSPRA